MLGIFHKGLAHPPQELKCPIISHQTKTPLEILKSFHSSNSEHCFSVSFNTGAALACNTSSKSSHKRLFTCVDDIYCIFVGYLHNLSSLIKDYGLCNKSTNEALLVVEAYRTLRDRGPYPADQVVKGLSGTFAFVVFDNKTGMVFVALSSDGGIPLYWGIASDGSVVICDDIGVVKESCGKSYAPFPSGCMFHSEGGLKSFEHPMNKMKAIPRVDSEGMMCGAIFNVDARTKAFPIPRVGSAENWSSWNNIYNYQNI